MDDIIERLEALTRLINEAAGEIERIHQAVDRLSKTGDAAQIRRLQAEIEGLRAALYLDVSAADSARVLASQSEETTRGR